MILDVIFYKSPLREFFSSMEMHDAIEEIKRNFVPRQIGIDRAAGVVGEVYGNRVRMSYMYSNRLNAWHSIFVGKFVREEHGVRLIGFYRRSWLVRVVSVIVTSFISVMIVLSSIPLFFGQVSDSVFVVILGEFFVFLLIYAIMRYGVNISREDEKAIDKILEISLRCTMRIPSKTVRN